jgi:ketosteroid isomerase-like protein
MKTVLDSERARADTLVAGDLDRLGAMLAEELVYVHATGVRHDKAQLLAYLQSGPRFLAVDLVAPRVSVMGDGALVVGELHLRFRRNPDGEPVQARSWVSQFWERREGDGAGWQLRLLQSTRMDMPVGG